MAKKSSYDNFSFDVFKKMAKDKSLSRYEKIGFPDEYRKGKEELIFADIMQKVPLLKNGKKLNILEIGPGCSDLPNYMIALCKKNQNSLTWCDSTEMLENLPDQKSIKKIPGPFPTTFDIVKKQNPRGFDVIICYSVFHYIAFEHNIFDFLDKAILLLKDGGQMIIGDIPNASKRRRFFASKNGIKFHQNFTKSKELPKVEYNIVQEKVIDESMLDAMINRARFSGCDAYLVPQDSTLPMSNRRDDLIIRKP